MVAFNGKETSNVLLKNSFLLPVCVTKKLFLTYVNNIVYFLLLQNDCLVINVCTLKNCRPVRLQFLTVNWAHDQLVTVL